MTARALVPVILAGGIGTRLWPVSRETMPKHLARLVGDESLLQQTARRLIALAPRQGRFEHPVGEVLEHAAVLGQRHEPFGA